jgi:tRNA dimethylallyltransferase
VTGAGAASGRPTRGPVPVVALVGPTASGKSDLGVAIALALGGEVVNADSMQVYIGMDIGTAKLTVAEQRGVVHHLLDVWPVTHPVSVVEYRERARAVIDDCLARRVVPVVVGGSGLYVQAALDELDFPGTDPAVRARLEQELAAQGSGAMHRRLAEADPDAARAILPGNGRRIVRALEVIEITGRPFAATLPAPVDRYPRTIRIGLSPQDADLDERIDARVDRMWEAGLVAEVTALEAVGLRDGRTASRALGYAQVLAALAGECTLEEARQATKQATRRFARRQRSWFRRDSRIVTLPAPDVDAALALIGEATATG